MISMFVIVSVEQVLKTQHSIHWQHPKRILDLQHRIKVRYHQSDIFIAPLISSFLLSVPTIYDCTFEVDFCNWIHRTDAALNWTRNQGSTDSFETGPAFDVTTQTSNSSLCTLSSINTWSSSRSRMVHLSGNILSGEAERHRSITIAIDCWFNNEMFRILVPHVRT